MDDIGFEWTGKSCGDASDGGIAFPVLRQYIARPGDWGDILVEDARAMPQHDLVRYHIFMMGWAV